MREVIEGVVYTIDPETGEILDTQPEAPKFTVHDQDSAEWVLKRLQEQDAQLDGLQAQEKAILDNLTIMRKRIEAKRNGLLYRFKQELEDFARDNLPKGKKSWVSPFGSVAFRSTPARLKVSDPAVALEWARVGAPGCIKLTEEFQISKLDANLKAELMEKTPSGFDVTLPGEVCEVKTGV